MSTTMSSRPAGPALDELLGELRAYLSCNPPMLSLPPRAFTDPHLYELEREKVFERCWWLVAHADELAEPGDYVALSIAGEPVVITRDADRNLHALSSVCRHKQMPVVEPGAGNTDAFTCPYHLWRYRLDGQLTGAPLMKGNPDFDPKSCRLPEFAVEDYGGLIYVNLDKDASPISAHMDLAAGELANYRLDEMVQVASWVEQWQANWKLAVENGSENYHVIGLHRSTLDPIMPGRNDVYIRPYSPWVTFGRFPFAQPIDAEVLPLTEEQQANATVVLNFPSGGLITFGDQLAWLSFIPQSIDRTEVRGGVLLPRALAEQSDPEQLRKDQIEGAASINEEDRIGLEAVQRGVGSRFAERGHLSPKEQPGVLTFYRNLARALVSGDDYPGEL
ncbi:aromatic ring-hydroxylating oxygenase subunit alpha [Nonomuraea sp. SYSU D8015]|uniref:aromatic ring-hydroxylating oxygenase subunit alpha n=1 Tax=Nonomuraea sp. SYSU D8015 TaxID=2593644 RepID=UPI001CB7193A|nr:aromatic ring-hydroxylating dioxygenase subunit alpha [Nonomuraea sp. SYSU D8015]